MRALYALSSNGVLLGVGDFDEVLAASKDLPGGTLVADGMQENGRQLPRQKDHVARAINAAKLPPISDADWDEIRDMDLQDAHAELRSFGIAGATVQGMWNGLLGGNLKLNKSSLTYMQERERSVVLANMDKRKVRGASSLGLNLLPHSFAKNAKDANRPGLALDLPLRTLCAGASAACMDSCLVYSGNNATESDAKSNLQIKGNKLRAMYKAPKAFLCMLRAAIDAHRFNCRAMRMLPTIRLNLLSDIIWEAWVPQLFRDYPDVQYYDYTKITGRRQEPNFPKNYDLTFSFNGINLADCKAELASGTRVAVVLVHVRPEPLKAKQYGPQEIVGHAAMGRNLPSPTKLMALPKQIKEAQRWQLPETLWGHKVFDGDITDLRMFDPTNVVVGLRWKIPVGRGVGANEKLIKSGLVNNFITPIFEENGVFFSPESPTNHTQNDTE